MPNANQLPSNLTPVKPRSVSELLTRALRYLDFAKGSMASSAQLKYILPFFRDTLELATNRKFLVPAPEFVKLATLPTNKRQFTWGIGADDINHAYPDTIHTMFLSSDNLVLYNSQGQRVAPPEATGSGTGAIWHFLEPMEATELAASTNYESGGIPTRFYLQRTTPFHILYLDSEPYGSENTLYAVATFPFLLPEDDDVALNTQLNLQTGHYPYLWAKTALMAAKEFGQADDVMQALAGIVGEAQMGITNRNYEVETVLPDNFDIFNRGYDNQGGTTRAVHRALTLSY